MIDPISLTAIAYVSGVIIGREAKKHHDAQQDEETKDDLARQTRKNPKSSFKHEDEYIA